MSAVAFRVGDLTGYLEGRMADRTEADLRFRLSLIARAENDQI